jgi:hypothetical protein
MFPLLLQIQDQSDYKEVIPFIISHLKSLRALHNSLLLCHQKYMTSLRNLPLDSHKFTKYSRGKQLTELQCDRTVKAKLI